MGTLLSFIQVIYRLNTDRPETDKFNHLKGLLTGSAYEAIEGPPITGEKYKKALEILETRYNNKPAFHQYEQGKPDKDAASHLCT